MRDYEAVFLFRPEEDVYNQGKNLVQEEFSKAGVSVSGEEDMGNRELAYTVKGEDRGHYYLYKVQAEPEKVEGLSAAARLMDSVLKFLFVRV